MGLFCRSLPLSERRNSVPGIYFQGITAIRLHQGIAIVSRSVSIQIQTASGIA
jgi:hypothetical protein